jgi:hypothetical protein
MAATESTRARAPRGAKAVVSAFMAALDSIPDARRMEVAKAAQLTIRDEMKTLAQKAKDAARKPAARKAATPAKVARKTVAKKTSVAMTRARRAKRAVAAAATPV